MAELAPLEAPGDFRLGFAGDTFNTAWYLRALRDDVAVSYLSAVGDDDISHSMLDFMDKAGIGTTSIERIPGRSAGLYMIAIRNGERSFSYWRDTSAARQLADDPGALARALAGADQIYFSGITLAILSHAGQGRLLTALGEARSKGKTIIFDPNLRPRLWDDQAQMTGTIMRGAAVSDMVLPSFEDEAEHFGDPDPAGTARRYAQVGAGCVIVKNGEGAIHYLNDGATGTVAVTPASRVVDTTAAGDSFNAGILATTAKAMPLADRITFASAVSKQVICGKGALVPLDKAALQG